MAGSSTPRCRRCAATTAASPSIRPAAAAAGRPRRATGTEALTGLLTIAVDELDVGPVHLVGLALGGLSAMRIAADRPDLLSTHALLNSSAGPHERSRIPNLLGLAAVTRLVGAGVPFVASRIEAQVYGKPFRDDPAMLPIRRQWRQRWAQADRPSLVDTLLGLIRRHDFRGELHRIAAPALIIAGGQDLSFPPANSLQMHALMPGSQLRVLRGVGHTSALEDPDAVTDALREHLANVGSPPV